MSDDDDDGLLDSLDIDDDNDGVLDIGIRNSSIEVWALLLGIAEIIQSYHYFFFSGSFLPFSLHPKLQYLWVDL